MKCKWRVVAWDIDGTLIDSEPLHERALLAVCENHTDNIDEIDPESFIGVHMHDDVIDHHIERLEEALCFFR